MTEIVKAHLLQLHAAGVPIQQAWLKYAPADLQTKWKQLQSQSAIEAFSEGVEAASQAEGDIQAKFQQALSGAQKILTARADLQRRLKANTLAYIAKGHLHGFGFELPRYLASVPVAVPKSAWVGKCDWSLGTLNHQGLELVALRLTTNRIRNEILGRGVVDQTPTKPAGRPAVGPAINAAFEALSKTGEIDPRASQSSHYPKVRAWLELNKPDLAVPPSSISEKTLYRYFSPFFKEL
jgi:hypothetical protein